MYLQLDKCPLSALADISYCAAGGLDHTECCMRNNVATTFAGKKCLTFCDQVSINFIFRKILSFEHNLNSIDFIIL